MTSRDRIYVAACALPPSEMRFAILEECVYQERSAELQRIADEQAKACTTAAGFGGEILDIHVVNFCVDPAVHR